MAFALTLLLHVGLLLALLYISAKPMMEPRPVQAVTVVNMQLIPQAQTAPDMVSPAKRPTQPHQKPKPKIIRPKPDVLVAESSPQILPSPPAPATPVASAPSPPRQPVSAGIVAPLPVAYLTRVMMTIGLNRRYPLKALANREQGTAVVHIHLSRDGSVLDAVVIRSSGYPALDEEARDVVLRIGKFQPLAPEYVPGADDFAIDQPIRFTGY